MVSINDHPGTRRVFEGFHFETTEIRYTTMNQRKGKAEVAGRLIEWGYFQLKLHQLGDVGTGLPLANSASLP